MLMMRLGCLVALCAAMVASVALGADAKALQAEAQALMKEKSYEAAAGKPWAYYNDDRTKWTDLSAPLYPGNTSGTVDNYMLVDTDICGLRRTQGKFNRGSTESFRKLGFGILVR